MTDASTKVIEYFLGQGLLGVIVVAMAVFIFYLLRQLAKRDEKIQELQEKRVTEGREGIAVLEQNTAALERLTEFVKARRS